MFYDYWRKLSFLSDISKILLLLILLFPPSSLFLQTPPLSCPKLPRETLWSLLAVLIWLMIWLTRLFLWIFLVSNLLCLPCVNVTRTSPSMPIVRRSQSTLSMIEVFLFLSSLYWFLFNSRDSHQWRGLEVSVRDLPDSKEKGNGWEWETKFSIHTSLWRNQRELICCPFNL